MTLGAAAVKVERVNGKPMRGFKPEHKNSRATRRGPMDEMRQLIRILAKLMPHSEPFLRVGGEDANGGNRVSEEQIRNYLAKSLGEAPQPEWGLPQGWGQYLADLFNWAKGSTDITADAARRCAKRGTGRPWEAVWCEVNGLGVYPQHWSLPLILSEVQQAQAAAQVHFVTKAPHALPIPVEPLQPQALTRKRSSASTSSEGAVKRARYPSTASEAAQPSSLPSTSEFPAICAAMDSLPPDMLLKLVSCASDLISQHGFSHRGDVVNQTEALRKLVSVLPNNVSAAVMAQQCDVNRQEDILARTERLLALYESKVTPAPHGGKQVGVLQHTNNVPNLFVGCPASEPLPAPAVDVVPEHNMCQKGKELAVHAAGKGKGALLESTVAPCKDGSMPKIDLQFQDASIQPDITNSQLHFLQCLQNSQDALPECPVGPSQENLFPLSQVGTGASDPLMGAPLSQGPWGGFSSDPLAGSTTSQLLASQPASMAPGVEKEEGS